MRAFRGPSSGHSSARAERLESRTLLSAGDLDPTFAGDGTLSVADTSLDRYAGDVALQPDGKVVVVGTRRPGANTTFANAAADVAVSRYNPDGTFGNGGRVVTDLGAAGAGNAVKVDGAGRIVVGAGGRGCQGGVKGRPGGVKVASKRGGSWFAAVSCGLGCAP
jgi:hypothetical protein